MAATSQPSLPFDAVRSASPSGERDATDDADARLKVSRPEIAHPPQYLFVRHPRARRYLIRVTEDGTVRVTVPRWGSKREAAAFAARERAWIEKQLCRADAERKAREREQSTTSGEAGGGRPNADELRALRERAKKELPPRLLELAAQHGLAVTRISIRNQRWRWGSCSRNGHICLNWRLVTMPEPVRDYVLIHELMHLKRMDHSPKFWNLVAQAFPPYKEARAWLRSQTARHSNREPSDA
jgi:predicted metal-dependent hydrolase